MKITLTCFFQCHNTVTHIFCFILQLYFSELLAAFKVSFFEVIAKWNRIKPPVSSELVGSGGGEE